MAGPPASAMISTMPWQSPRALTVFALAAILIVVFMVGVLFERLRFDSQRTEMLRRYDQALRRQQQLIMQVEKEAGRARAGIPD